MVSITIYVIRNKYKTALLEHTYVEGLNRIQFLLLCGIQVMQELKPEAEPEDIIPFIEDKSNRLPKEIAELRMLKQRSLLYNLTLLLKKGVV